MASSGHHCKIIKAIFVHLISIKLLPELTPHNFIFPLLNPVARIMSLLLRNLRHNLILSIVEQLPNAIDHTISPQSTLIELLCSTLSRCVPMECTSISLISFMLSRFGNLGYPSNSMFSSLTVCVVLSAVGLFNLKIYWTRNYKTTFTCM